MTETSGASEDASAVRIGGVRYVAVDPAAMTFEHQLMAAGEISAAQLRPIEEYAAMGHRAGAAILGDAYKTKHAFTLLATLLEREGEPWEPEHVPVIAEAFRTARGKETRSLSGLLVAALVGVFQIGTLSLQTSTASSAEPTKHERPGDTPAHLGTITDNGTPSFASSRTTTRGATRKSRAGRSVRDSRPTASASAPTPDAPTTGT